LHTGAVTLSGLPSSTIPINNSGCVAWWVSTIASRPCESFFGQPAFPGQCDCAIMDCTAWSSPASTCAMLFHESQHCGGSGGGEHHNNPPYTDAVYAVACCVCKLMNPKTWKTDCRTECGGFK
jgi:hypothetical protein